MSSMWKNNISFSIFGESHGKAIGVVIDNLPSGEYIDMEKVAEYMQRRAPKKDGTTTNRSEKDVPEVLSGLLNDKTTGTPLCAMIMNTDTKSNDYKNVSTLARPGHADYTGNVRYKGYNDVRGGGHFSGRLTAPLCFVGAVCSQILERRGIYVGAHISQIHNIKDVSFDAVSVSRDDILDVREKSFPTISDAKGEMMVADILKAREGMESLGGIIECVAINVPAGIGSPMFDGLENTISQLMFGIPAVKGVELGAGLDVENMTGSQDNDNFYVDDRHRVRTKTNNHGGILGGISSGMPIVCKVAIKPTPSIAQEQQTINYTTLENDVIKIKGRHDPCIVPRAVPCVEACMSIAILSHMIGQSTPL